MAVAKVKSIKIPKDKSIAVVGKSFRGVPDRHHGIWVFIEQREGHIMPVSFELLGEGRRLAEKLGVELSGVLLGDRVAGLAHRVYEYGANRVYLVDDPVLRHYRTETYAPVFVRLVERYRPEIILLGATITGRDLAGAVAADLGTGLTADCTALDIDPGQRLLLSTRPALGGNIMATIITREHRPQMATVRSKVLPMPTPETDRGGELVALPVELMEEQMITKVLDIVREQSDQVPLSEAEIIVAGGRGLKNKAGFREICYGLAGAVGARVGGSRAAVEAGWIEPRFQVGQTGVTVAPKIYFALGISGAIQHLVGIRNADIVIAVNTDPAAQIFSACTYGIVGDVFKIAPLLKDSLQEMLTRQQ
jgi:electron transfer flavoprotein alpha subunit